MRASDIQPGQKFVRMTDPHDAKHTLVKVAGPGCYGLNSDYGVVAVHPDAACELVGADARDVNGALTFNITHHDSNKSLSGRIEVTEHGIDVFFDGYGQHSMEPGYGSPVFMEVGDNGEPLVYCWAEIDSEDYSHKINLAHARDTRQPQPA